MVWAVSGAGKEESLVPEHQLVSQVGRKAHRGTWHKGVLSHWSQITTVIIV